MDSGSAFMAPLSQQFSGLQTYRSQFYGSVLTQDSLLCSAESAMPVLSTRMSLLIADLFQEWTQPA